MRMRQKGGAHEEGGGGVPLSGSFWSSMHDSCHSCPSNCRCGGTLRGLVTKVPEYSHTVQDPHKTQTHQIRKSLEPLKPYDLFSKPRNMKRQKENIKHSGQNTPKTPLYLKRETHPESKFCLQAALTYRLTLAKKEAKRWERVWVFLALNPASFSASILRRHLSRRSSRQKGPVLPSTSATPSEGKWNSKP